MRKMHSLIPETQLQARRVTNRCWDSLCVRSSSSKSSPQDKVALLTYIISLICMHIFPSSVFIRVEAIHDILDNCQAYIFVVI